jgi:hypothetical protein
VIAAMLREKIKWAQSIVLMLRNRGVQVGVDLQGPDACMEPSVNRSFVYRSIKGERTDTMMTYSASIGV